MDKYFSKVKDYLLELECTIVAEDEQESVFVIDNEDVGIKNLIIACDEPILIMEMHLFSLKEDKTDVLKKLLQINRDIVHGAFVLDETGKNVLFRDTLQIENLDINELQGSLNALILLLSEYTDEMIRFAKN